MNRKLTTIFTCCVCVSAQAAVIDVPDAKLQANLFFGGDVNFNPVPSSAILETGAGSDVPTFYIINNPSGGWMILSAEDSAIPVLAYSKTGSFPTSDICPSTLEWMRGIDSGIAEMRVSGTGQRESVKSKWDTFGISSSAEGTEVILETAAWDQREPFNNLCPQIGGKNCVAGCVATAMAIICRYHQWPRTGKGSSEAYTTTTGRIRIPARDFSSHTYKWSDMPLDNGEGWTSEQESAVALLMYDIGVMVRMDYTTTASGASSTMITGALKDNLSYSKNARGVIRQDMDLNEWFYLLKSEIDASRPVLFSGATADMKNGHSFVCDGYDNSHKIHINWGWGGDGNGFFATTWLGDEETTHYIFNGYEEAIIGVQPDKSQGYGTSAASLAFWAMDDLSGITLKSGSPATGSSFTLDIGYIGNQSADADYSGNIKAVLIDKNGKSKEDVSEPAAITIKKMTETGSVTCAGLTNVKCGIKGTVSPGDAIAVMYSLPDGSWARIGGKAETNAISLMSAYDACFIGNPASYDAGCCIYPSLIQGHKQVKSIDWSYDGNAIEKGYVTAESGEHRLKAKVTLTDGTTETVVHSIKVL